MERGPEKMLGEDAASRGRNYSGLKEALRECLPDGSDRTTAALLERKPTERKPSQEPRDSAGPARRSGSRTGVCGRASRLSFAP